MYILQVQMRCYAKFFEVSPDEVENAELMVEDVVSRVLLDLFGGGTVDDVSICFSSHSHTGLQQCAIQITAQCSCRRFAMLPRTKENIEFAVEKRISSLLRELFGSVNVDRVTLSPPSWGMGNDPALSHSL